MKIMLSLLHNPKVKLAIRHCISHFLISLFMRSGQLVEITTPPMLLVPKKNARRRANKCFTLFVSFNLHENPEKQAWQQKQKRRKLKQKDIQFNYIQTPAIQELRLMCVFQYTYFFQKIKKSQTRTISYSLYYYITLITIALYGP